MRLAAVLLALVWPGVAAAAPVATVVRAQLEPHLPPGLAIREIHLPRGLAALDVADDAVALELSRTPRAGRSSVKVTVRGRATAFVPVVFETLVRVAVARRAIAAGERISATDIELDDRPAALPLDASLAVGSRAVVAIARGAVIGRRDVALPPPIARGTRVTVALRHGGVTVRGPGVLELAARIGEPAAVRLVATRQVVHGIMIDESSVRVEGTP